MCIKGEVGGLQDLQRLAILWKGVPASTKDCLPTKCESMLSSIFQIELNSSLRCFPKS